MSPDPQEEQGFDQHGGFETRVADQDRTLATVHQLEEALASAAPGRERAWQDVVLTALAELEQATTEEFENAERPDSLLSDIKRNQPRLRTRVRGLRTQYQQIRERIAALRQELADEEAAPDVADVRHRISGLLTTLRHQRARESDLLYEAYYDAFQSDLEGP